VSDLHTWTERWTLGLALSLRDIGRPRYTFARSDPESNTGHRTPVTANKAPVVIYCYN